VSGELKIDSLFRGIQFYEENHVYMGFHFRMGIFQELHVIPYILKSITLLTPCLYITKFFSRNDYIQMFGAMVDLLH
jgi:hypothetical protein